MSTFEFVLNRCPPCTWVSYHLGREGFHQANGNMRPASTLHITQKFFFFYVVTSWFPLAKAITGSALNGRLPKMEVSSVLGWWLNRNHALNQMVDELQPNKVYPFGPNAMSMTVFAICVKGGVVRPFGVKFRLPIYILSSAWGVAVAQRKCFHLSIS